MATLLLARDVASILNLKTSSIYQLAQQGVLPHVRVTEGRRRPIVRFRREDIDEFVSERIVKATSKETK